MSPPDGARIALFKVGVDGIVGVEVKALSCWLGGALSGDDEGVAVNVDWLLS